MPRLIAIILLALIGSAGLAVGAEPSPPAPETVNLKERYKVEGRKPAVIFNHKLHQTKLECPQCHLPAEAGGGLVFTIGQTDTISNDFHRKVCWPCHDALKVAGGKTCPTCHK